MPILALRIAGRAGVDLSELPLLPESSYRSWIKSGEHRGRAEETRKLRGVRVAIGSRLVKRPNSIPRKHIRKATPTRSSLSAIRLPKRRVSNLSHRVQSARGLALAPVPDYSLCVNLYFWKEERAFVTRRWMAMLVLWAALFGLALPAAACTSALSAHCCPSGSGQHCPGFPLYAKADSANTCCTVAPALSRIASTSADRARHAVHAASGSLDPVALPAWTLLDQALRPAAGPIRSLASSYWHDASLTYLHTARLRI